MSSRSRWVVFLTAMSWPWLASGAGAARPDIYVRIYDSSSGMGTSDGAALDHTREVLSAANINVVWHRCFAVPCETPLLPGEVIVRVVRSARPAQPRDPVVLGDAWVDSLEGAGVLATVYIDRVRHVAAETHVDSRRLLGRAIAHELGHLLLASRAHPAVGLMRATWQHAEIQRDDWLDWTFTPTEAEAMVRRVLAMTAQRSLLPLQVAP